MCSKTESSTSHEVIATLQAHGSCELLSVSDACLFS